MTKIAAGRAVPPRDMVSIEAHAAGTLHYIRATMEAAGSLPVPGMAALVTGSIGLIAGSLAALPGMGGHALSIWIGAALVAFPCGSVLMLRTWSRRAVFSGGSVRRLCLCLLPALTVGVVLTWTLASRDSMDLVPAVWLLLYGCAVLSVSSMTLPWISWMGAAFLVLGIAALEVPREWANALLTTGFGGVQSVFGILMRRLERV